MTHDTDNAPADIAWMRRLAEEGSQAPMQGGSILMTAGLSYGVASIVHWLGATGRMAGFEQWVNYVWFAATGVFFVGIRNLGPSTTSIITTFEPVLTIVAGVIFLGESFTLARGIGAAFVIGALIVFGLLESRSTKTPEVL